MLDLDDDTERLIKALADKTGKSPAAIVHDAVEATARAAGVTQAQHKRSRDDLIAGMKVIADRSAARPVLDTRSADDILGYDADGLPT